MNSRLIAFTRILQLAGGFVILLLGFWMWLHIFLIDLSTGAKPESRIFSFLFPVLLLTPGVFVLVGSYLQTVHGKRWPVVLVIIGSVGLLIFVGVNVAFVFLYSGDKWGVRAVFTDLFVVGFTFGAGMINAFAPKHRTSELAT